MGLDLKEKMLAEAAYARLHSRHGSVGIIVGASMGAAVAVNSSIWKCLTDPRTPRSTVIFLSVLIGALVVSYIVAAFLMSRQRKQDAELVRFFERRFPDDCSWKQEEKILAEAEDLRLKAKADYLLHKSA